MGYYLAVSPWFKRAIWLLVMYGMLCVLLSPLPVLNATFSGKLSLHYVVPLAYALFALFFLIFVISHRVSQPGFTVSTDVLHKICLQLC